MLSSGWGMVPAASGCGGGARPAQRRPWTTHTWCEWRAASAVAFTDIPLAERGLHADHVTVWRWVQRYAPEKERRLRSRLRPTNDSWRVDETYIRVKGKWVYLYRAVDSSGATIDFLLSRSE